MCDEILDDLDGYATLVSREEILPRFRSPLPGECIRNPIIVQRDPGDECDRDCCS